MFRFPKHLDIVTIFHQPRVQPSVRALALLKQLSAQASETATEDQASDHSHQNKVQRSEFELNVSEDPPTEDQLRTIFDYIGANKASQVVEGSSSVSDALKKLQEDKKKFKAPVIVDWNNGKAVIGDSESEILKLIGALPKAEA